MLGPTMRGMLAGLAAFAIFAFGFTYLVRSKIEGARPQHAELRRATEGILTFLQASNFSVPALRRAASTRYLVELSNNADQFNEYRRITEYGGPLVIGPTFAYRIVDGPADTKIGWIYLGLRFNQSIHLTEMRLIRINNVWKLDLLAVNPEVSAETAPDPMIMIRSLIRPREPDLAAAAGAK